MATKKKSKKVSGKSVAISKLGAMPSRSFETEHGYFSMNLVATNLLSFQGRVGEMSIWFTMSYHEAILKLIEMSAMFQGFSKSDTLLMVQSEFEGFLSDCWDWYSENGLTDQVLRRKTSRKRSAKKKASRGLGSSGSRGPASKKKATKKKGSKA